MGVSIYYNAKRNTPLTEKEISEINFIIEKYNQEMAEEIPNEDERGEDFCVYPYQPDEPELVFSGATKLPANMDTITTVIFCGINCLNEIRYQILPDADWHVHIDDTDFVWTEEDGWLPGY